MNRTKIEWCDYTINPVKGLCPMGCSYCYARRMYKRFKWNPEIRYDPDAFKGLPSKPARVFVGSTMELFGDWIDRDWMHMTFAKILARPQHTFIFLTKQPQNLIKWSPFPENCWAGVTATNDLMAIDAKNYLENIQAKVKYISFEPLLQWGLGPSDTGRILSAINWLVIGACTGTWEEMTKLCLKYPELTLASWGKQKWTAQPCIEWLQEIVEAAAKAGIPVFLKNNLKSSLAAAVQENIFWQDLRDSRGFEPLHLQLRQETPKND